MRPERNKAETALQRPGIGLAAGIAFAMAVLAPPNCLASSGGIIGYSGKSANKNCNNCHSGGQIPTVSFEGPTRMAPGAVATFRFIVQSNSVNQKAAGFNVAVTGGTLAVVTGQDEQLFGGELTHTKAKANNSGQASWEFTWEAPATPGRYDIFASGNSVNRSVSGALGDRSAAEVYTIDVVGGATPTQTQTFAPETATPTEVPATSTAIPSATSSRRSTPIPTPTRTRTATATPTATPTPPMAIPLGDANCDTRVGAADLPALVEQLEAGGLGGCIDADPNCDTVLDSADVDELLNLLFGGAPPPACLQSP